jgi:stage II sporulation protein D
MRRRGVFSLAIALISITACVHPRTPRPAPFGGPEVLRVRANGRIQSVPIEEYVVGAALSEHTPLGTDAATVARIFDVQAVLARTYAVGHRGRHAREGFDLCDSTHCQLYQPGRITTSRFAGAARRAVERTRGIVMTFGRQPVDALYHSDCGGHTASADDVWGNVRVPYLLGTPDDVPATHRTWQFEAPANDIRAALNRDARSSVGRRLDSITIATRDVSGRASRIQVRGEHTRSLRGEDVRAILNRTFGDRAIMSTRFSVVRQGNAYRFTGTGFGHGVGLCQAGAAARAARGAAMDDILAVYFPGSSLARLSLGSVARTNLSGRATPVLLKSP